MNKDRRPIVAGNWKMNKGGRDGPPLAACVAEETQEMGSVEVVVAPPFTALAAVSQQLAELKSAVTVAAQNLYFEASGAFTGEISGQMLLDSGATSVIIGHSERRHVLGETDEVVAKKVAQAMALKLRPIACVGELLEEREAGKTVEVVERQVQAFLELIAKEPGVAVIAYEPVWAIGTGKVAKPEDAQEIHGVIRGLLAKASDELASCTRILYGGSVKADNALGLLGQEDIDGALVGGASLDATGFAKIAAAAQELAAKG